MKTRLKLFFKWGIQFEEAYSIEEKSERKVQYADCREVEAAVTERFHPRAVEPVSMEFAENYDVMDIENAISNTNPFYNC